MAALLVFLAVLALACGGARTSYPAPDPITLLVNQPAEGVVLDTANLVLMGQVSKVDAFVACNGNPVTVDARGAFRASLQLTVGENLITVQAWRVEDAKAGRGSGLLPPQGRVAAQVVRKVSYRLPDLTLVVAQPSEGAVFTVTPISAAGTVSDASASVTLNGMPQTVDASGHFAGNFELASGTNLLTFQATASGSRSASATRTVTYTPVGPGALSVHIQAPAEGLLTRAAMVPVTGTVSDPTASLSVNGQPTVPEHDGTWSLVLAPPEGSITILAQATLGSLAAQDARHITVDRTPPVITCAVPALVTSPTLALQGQVDDPTALLTLNGQSLSLDASGTFRGSIGLSQGPNTLHFLAVDPAGNMSGLDLHTVLDNIAPVVTITTPVEGWITNQHNVLVKGSVDDPAARLLIAGQSLMPEANGAFEVILSPAEGAQLIVALATDPAGNTGHATRGITVDWTPPVITFLDPTPAEGSLWKDSKVPLVIQVNEVSTLQVNGQFLPADAPTDGRILAKWDLSADEGVFAPTVTATDRAGNVSTATRTLQVGLTVPMIEILSPALDAAGQFTTRNPNMTLRGRVRASDFVKPFQMTRGGVPLEVNPDGSFTFDWNLLEGSNTVALDVLTRFGHRGQRQVLGNRYTTPFGVRIEWPLNGFVTPLTSTEVKGRVQREGTAVSVNGVPAPVDPRTLTFVATLPLSSGENTLVAVATDTVGNTGQDQVKVTAVQGVDTHYRWESPANKARFATRTIRITGQADLPGVSSVTVNGTSLPLSGIGTGGHFEGDLRLDHEGLNVLLMEVRTMDGDPRLERRDVYYQPTLPRIRLINPDSARPGDSISVQVLPELGTNLQYADLKFQGRFLARVSAPFAPIQVQIPSAATVGGSLLLEALGQDDQDQQVQARGYVTIYGGGALLVKAFDDRTGLPFRKDAPVSGATAAMPVVTVAVEGGESHALDDRGQAALATALPSSWVKISSPGWAQVWRLGGLKSGQAEALIGARLTPLADPKTVDLGAEGIQIQLADPRGQSLSVTPLSGQGLPALLPLGWSPIRAWWIEGSATFPGKASVTLPSTAPPELASALFQWVKWDAEAKQWTALAVAQGTASLTDLPITGAGGCALILRDPDPIHPPEPLVGEKLQGVATDGWREGLKLSTSQGFQVMPTTEAIQGARMEPSLRLEFDGEVPLPSGLILQADTLESYVMFDQRLIEPESYSQDLALHRYSLLVQPDGSHQLLSPSDSLLLRFPIRMSRRFTNRELVEGRILVGFYHDGTRLLESGTDLFGVNGGQVTRDGIQALFEAGAFTASTLVRLQGEPDAVAVWPELSTLNLVKAFQLDVVGNLQKGVGFRFTDLNLDAGAKPILLARRVVHGERLILAVGELEKQGSSWCLKVTENLLPVLEGGAFAVLVPNQAWGWQSGVTYAPGALLQAQRQKSVQATKSLVAGDNSLPDVVLNAGWFKAVSGADGHFAAPAILPATETITLSGERRDLGLAGSLTASVPATGLELRLASIPFKLLAVSPVEGAVVGLGEALEIATSTPIDPGGFQDVRLLMISPGVEPILAASRISATSTKAATGSYQTARIPSQVSKISAQPTKGSTPTTEGKSSKAKRASEKTSAKPRSAETKNAQTLLPDLAPSEVPLRRTLSLDGRTLLLVPEQILQAGAEYKLAIQNLRGASGEVLSLAERNFKAVSQAVNVGVDFNRMQVSYPNEQFDITVTVPAGAAPAWSAVEVEASSFGSSGTAIMPPLGDLTFQLKAGLGEPLAVTVHLRDGNQIQGTLSRYVADDGRTTLSQAGGRVEGPGGLAMVIPAGALDSPVEFKLLPLTEPIQVADGVLQEGETIQPALQVQIKGSIHLTQMPVVEFPATLVGPEMDTTPRLVENFGNGPITILAKAFYSLPDGSRSECFQVVDSGLVKEENGTRKVVTQGGLRYPDAESTPQSLVTQRTLPSAKKSVGVQSTAAGPVAASALDCATRMVAGVDIQPPFQTSQAALSLLQMGGGGFAAELSLQLVMLSYPALSTGFKYHSGRVFRNFNSGEGCDTPSDTCYAPLAGAEVYRGVRRVPGISDPQRGRILAVTDDCGRYVINGIPFYDPYGTSQEPDAHYNAIDPRTGTSSEDDPQIPANHSNSNRNFWIWIKTKVNPFDPNLRPPRVLASLRDMNGLSRTVFHVGQSANLHVDQGSDSVPVTALKLKGDGGLDQTLNSVALPLDIPVIFDKPGSWTVAITGWSTARVQTDTSVQVLVTPYSDLGPSKPGQAPRLLSRSPRPDAERDPQDKVSPSDMVKLTFSEPVRVLTPQTAFWMKKVDAVTGTSEPLAFQILSDGAEVTGPDQLVVEVWLVPTQRWPLGAKIQVGVEATILDQDREQFVPVTWGFTVRGAEEVGAIQSGTLTDMVVHKGRLFAVEKLGESLLDPLWDTPGYPISGLRIFDVSSPNQPKLGVLFGAHGSVSPILDPVYATFETKRPDMLLKDGVGKEIAVEPFFRHRIRMIRKAEGISLNGLTRDLLLVATAPRMATLGSATYVPNVQNQQGTTNFIMNSTIWAFDITGDPASQDVNGAPKLLMSSSIGKTTGGTSIFGLPSGLGSAGDYLGVIWRLAGMKILSAPDWRQAFIDDAAALGFTEAQLARRSRNYQGYYPGGGSVVATNDISHQHYEMPESAWIGHAVISGDDDGKPVAIASLGLNGKLAHIDTKLGENEAMVAYEGAPLANWDDRVQDLGATVGNERVLRVETLRGTWQGNNGTDQGLLLLVATDKTFWVLKGVWEKNKPFRAVPLAKAKLPDLSTDQDNPWTKVDIQTDVERMLVGVKSAGKGLVFDLKNLKSTDSTLPTLVPIYEFTGAISWTLNKGFLFADDVANLFNRLVARNLDGVQIEGMAGIPVLTEISTALAGAFYRYNARVLGEPNPPAPDAPPSELVYAITDLYNKNGGAPWLRYYYPDLGEMNVTASIQPNDSNKLKDMLKPDSKWFVEATGTLMDGDQAFENVVDVRGLNVVGGHLIGEATTNRIRVQEVIYTESLGGESMAHTLDYTPFKFKISQAWLNGHDQTIRTDERERFRVRIHMRLFQSEDDRARDVDQGSKTLEFSVKFNTNTRLFDIARGGVWYFDPNVSGDDPFDTGMNPFTDQWYAALAQQGLGDVELQTALQTRLSLTPGQSLAKGTVLSDGGVVQDRAVSYDFQNLGLDLIQTMLDRALVPLRRQVFQDGSDFRSIPMPLSYRSTFLQAADGPIQGLRAKGDVPGAFGYRTAHALNAVQSFSEAEAGPDGWRDLNRADYWQSDPAAAPTDKTLGGWASIMPALRQQLKDKAGKAYPGNTLIHYLVAYPRLQTQGENFDPRKGLFPINTMLTRDLIFGPSPLPWDGMDSVALDGRTFQGQRQAMDALLQQVNGLPGKSDPAYDEIKVRDLFLGLQAEVLAQDIIVDKGSPLFRKSGQYFNPGVGILQLGLQANWLRRRGDDGDTFPGYIPNNNSHVLVLSDPVPSLRSDQLTSTPQWAVMKRRVLTFLIAHPKARRVDLYINGVQNVAIDLEDSADRLQRSLVDQEFPDPLGHGEEVPLIAVYNDSSKLFYGGTSRRIVDAFDWPDILAQKNDAARPDRPTTNPDSLRLIAALRAVVETVCAEPGFRDAFLLAHVKDINALGSLDALRQRITIHAHSQGAIIASVAQTRLGDYAVPRPTGYPIPEPIAPHVSLVTYGGGANMLDWGATPYFRSYLHQANAKDAIAAVTGMGDPFQSLIRSAVLGADLLPGSSLIGIPLGGFMLTQAAGRNILKGPSDEVKSAYAAYHRVIHHSSPCTSLNIKEHNFGNGYLCHVGQDPVNLPLWPTRPFINECDGGPGCLPMFDCDR